jgi:hypothetical protein
VGTLTPIENGEIKIIGPITADRVLGVPGMAINYIYKGNNYLASVHNVADYRLYISLAAHQPKKILWKRIQPSRKVFTPGGR